MKEKVFLLLPLLAFAACDRENPAGSQAGGEGKPAKHSPSALPTPSEDGENSARGKNKSAERPQAPRKPPVASVAAGQPGMVISPFSNEPVDVSKYAPGALVRDPKFPGDETKMFTVPEGVEIEEPQQKNPVALAVPDRAGFVFSPYNNKIVDVTGIPAGGLVADPTYPASEKKYFRTPEPSPDAGSVPIVPED